MLDGRRRQQWRSGTPQAAPAIGLTDHGYGGAYDYTNCRTGVKPIIERAYVSPLARRALIVRRSWGEPWQRARRRERQRFLIT